VRAHPFRSPSKLSLRDKIKSQSGPLRGVDRCLSKWKTYDQENFLSGAMERPSVTFIVGKALRCMSLQDFSTASDWDAEMIVESVTFCDIA
jgi:hypothetical protein